MGSQLYHSIGAHIHHPEILVDYSEATSVSMIPKRVVMNGWKNSSRSQAKGLPRYLRKTPRLETFKQPCTCNSHQP